MPEKDLLSEILSSDPNEPCPMGAVLLLRTEMKSGFKAISQRFDRMDERFDRMDERFDRMDERFNQMDESFKGLKDSVEMIAQQIAILVTRK